MIQKQHSLKEYNTFGIEAKAYSFAKFQSIDELVEILQSRKSINDPLLILGGGSNILLTRDYEGLAIKNELTGIDVVEEDEQQVKIRAMAGEVWHELVMYAVSNGYGGIENLSLIPGSVGAAPMQNIGAYGVEIKDVFVELEALNRKSLQIETFTKENCKFGYRESVFKRDLKDQYIILSVTLLLSKKHQLNTSYGAIEQELTKKGIDTPGIKDVSEAVIAIRQSKLPDPAEIGNSGSFFKNPVVSAEKFEQLKSKFPDIANYPLPNGEVKLAAGWLIDQAGWKGKTIGNYGVHKNQALVLVNYGGASGADIWQLSEDILQSVKDIYDVDLEREVNII
ncbi:MAG: UDP-N-acetylmuramate dehydrogenase [Flavobacteriales bacterium]|nr:UDP-N-acetylmuramate dehydrogenase [Flavobacteriales bacterium]